MVRPRTGVPLRARTRHLLEQLLATGSKGMKGPATDAVQVDFQSLLDPVAVEEFFGGIFGRRVLHVPGNPRKFLGLFSWSEFNRILNMSKLWSDRSMKLVLDGRDVSPDSYSVSGLTREGNRAQIPYPPEVEALLQRGATLILDLVETLSPGIRAIARALTASTGSVVVCNAYCSFKAHQGFLPHYDTTDVFALHIEGSKVWRIYEGVADHPVDLPGYHFSSFTPDHHAGARGNVALEVEMRPGDLLYVPRGQYHEALASSDACLHLSFGTNRATGLDFVGLLSRWVADDLRFRASLPHFDDGVATQKHLGALGDALRDWTRSPEVAARVCEWQRNRAFRDGIHEFELPRVDDNPRYHVRGPGIRVEKSSLGTHLITASGQRMPLTDAEAAAVESFRSRDVVDRALIASFFFSGESAALDRFIARLLESGALERA